MSFEQVTDYENLKTAGLLCCKGGRWKTSIKNFEQEYSVRAAEMKEKLENGTYYPKKTHDFVIHERGKKRLIKAHAVQDRMVYKSFCTHELWPAVKGLVIQNNFASQVGKGTSYAIKTFRKDLCHAYHVCHGRHFYVVTCDFHNYFGTIDHNIAYDLVAPRLSDDRCRLLLKQYLDLFLPKEEQKRVRDKYKKHTIEEELALPKNGVGIGIGGEPSQILAIIYPSYIDRRISCMSNVLGYGRYMDDTYIIVRTRNEAREIMNLYQELAEKMHLIINPKHTKIHNMEKDRVTFLKKRTFLTETGKIIMEISRKNVTSEMKRLKKYHKLYLEKRIDMKYIIDAYHCWFNYANLYNSYHALTYSIHGFEDIFEMKLKDAIKIAYQKKNKPNYVDWRYFEEMIRPYA